MKYVAVALSILMLIGCVSRPGFTNKDETRHVASIATYNNMLSGVDRVFAEVNPKTRILYTAQTSSPIHLAFFSKIRQHGYTVIPVANDDRLGINKINLGISVLPVNDSMVTLSISTQNGRINQLYDSNLNKIGELAIQKFGGNDGR